MYMQDNNFADQTQTVAIGAIILLLTAVVIAAVAAVATMGNVALVADADDRFDDGETQLVDSGVDERPDILDVRATTEYGLALDGSGYAEAETPDNWSDASWSVAAVGELDGDANQAAAYTLVGVDNGSIEISFDAGEWVGYYHDGGEDAVVSVDASDATDETGVVLTFDDEVDELTIYADDASDSATLDGDVATRNATWEWVGMVDEVRFFDAELSQSDAEAFADDPIQPVAAGDTAARYMFDEGAGSTSDAFYADLTASLEGSAGWGSGVEDPGLEEGSDYELAFAPFEVTVLAGGYLVDAPVVHVSYADGVAALMQRVSGLVGSALGLAAIGLVLIIAGVIIVMLPKPGRRQRW